MRVLFVQHQEDCPPGLVGDRLGALGAALEVVPARSPRLPDPAGFDLVVPLGSDDSAADESVSYLRGEWELLERAVAAGVPVFGICFGAQLLGRVLGGRVRTMPEPEIGWLRVDGRRARVADDGLVGPGPWLTWHLDAMEPGPRSTEVARSGRTVQAFVHGPHVGVQFHPEATVASVRVWAEHYHSSLARLGLDPVAVVTQARERAASAQLLADALVDRIVARVFPAVPRPARAGPG